MHIPFCTSKCSYCAFYSEPIAKHNPERLMQAIHKELSLVDVSSVCTVYIGGGSPSCLPKRLLCDLVRLINGRCSKTIREFTIECNPGQVKPAMLESLQSLGVNRLSFGAQSFNPEELKLLGRCHTAQAVENAVPQARAAGFENISLDLIFAICNQTQKTWQKSLDKAIALEPEHISAYALTLEAGTPLAKVVEQGIYPSIDEETDRAMYMQAIDTLARAGYEQYEISNFSKSGYQCRHNLLYWQNQPYIGIGPAAASSSGSYRTTNIADIDSYIDAIEAGRNPVDETIQISSLNKICETAVLNLRMTDGIDVHKFRLLTGYDPAFFFAESIKKHNEQGLLDIKKGRIALTNAALPVADYVLCDFASID